MSGFPMTATRWAAALASCILATTALVAQAPQPRKEKPPKSPNDPYFKLAEPWPDAEATLRRKTEAEKRPLFMSDAPLALTIKADFRIINKDRFEKSAA